MHVKQSLKISVILPTHNRSQLLVETLDSLCDQTLPVDAYEVIVVDNASTDDTANVTRNWLRDAGRIRPGISGSYLHESQLGLHYARHAGVRTAHGEFLAFIDDDGIADPGWLEALLAQYDRPQAGAVGGKITPRWMAAPPDWLVPYAPGNLSLLDLGEEVRILEGPHIFGCNFSVRKSVLYGVGGFNPDSFGDIWLGDGETGLLLKILNAGYEVVYTPHAVVEHVIPPRRMTVQYLRLRRANQGASDAYTYYRQYLPRRRHLFRRTWLCWLDGIKHQMLSLIHLPTRSTEYYRCALGAAYYFSQSRYFWRLSWDQRFRRLAQRSDWLTED